MSEPTVFLAADSPDRVPFAWVATIIGALISVVVLFWKLLDGRASKRIEDEIARTKEASDEARRYEAARDKAMELNIANAERSRILAERIDKLTDALSAYAAECRDGQDRLEAKLDAAVRGAGAEK